MPYLGAILGLVAGGAQGFMGAQQNNAQGAQIRNAYGNLPGVPDLENEGLSGYFKQLQFTPQALALEHSLRSEYLPQEAQQSLDLYSKFGPQYAAATRHMLDVADPTFNKAHDQLYGIVSKDAALGSQLSPDQQGEIQQYVRGGQAARGNYLGNAPITQEAFTQGSAGEALKQQRIGNLGRFLAGPSSTNKTGGPLGPGGAALGISQGAAAAPGYNQIQGPQDWSSMYLNAAQTEFQDANGQALAKAGALAGAPPNQNPWLSSVMGGLAGLGGSMGGGGGEQTPVYQGIRT